MPSCCCHLESAFDVFLTFHLVEIIGEGVLLCVELLSGVDKSGLKLMLPVEVGDDVVEVSDAINGEVVHHCGFTGIVFGHEKCLVAEFSGFDGDGQDAFDGQDVAVQPEFPDEHVLVGLWDGEEMVGQEDCDGNGEVEACPFLADVGRGEVDDERVARRFVAVGAQG